MSVCVVICSTSSDVVISDSERDVSDDQFRSQTDTHMHRSVKLTHICTDSN